MYDVPNEVQSVISNGDTVRKEFEGNSMFYGISSLIGGFFFFGFLALWGFFFVGGMLQFLHIPMYIGGGLFAGLMITIWLITTILAFRVNIKIYVTDDLIICYKRTPFSINIKERKINTIKNTDSNSTVIGPLKDGKVNIETDMDSKDLTIKHISKPYELKEEIDAKM